MFSSQYKTSSTNSFDQTVNMSHGLIIETVKSFVTLYSQAESRIESSLTENDGVLTESTKEIMQESTDANLTPSIDYLKKLIDNVETLKAFGKKTLQDRKKLNNEFVKDIGPKLKRMNTRNITYATRGYTMDKFDLEAAIFRLTRVLNVTFGTDLTLGIASLNNAVRNFKTGKWDYIEEIKRGLLGMPNSINLDMDFFKVIEGMVVTNDVNANHYSDSALEGLDVSDIWTDKISGLLDLLNKDLKILQAAKNQRVFEGVNREYALYTISMAAALRISLYASAIAMIEDIFRFKLRIENQKDLELRKGIQSVYDEALRTNEDVFIPVPEDDDAYNILVTESAMRYQDLP